MSNVLCKICNQEAEQYPRMADREDINCPYCGKYTVTGFDIDSCFQDKSNFYKVSSWIRERNEFNLRPEIDFSKFEQILNMKDKKIKEKFDLMMNYLSNLKEQSWLNDSILVKCWMKNTIELDLLINKALDENLLDVQLSRLSLREYEYPLFKNLKFEGLEYIENLEEPNKNSKNIFIAFNFTDELIPIFSNQVKEAVEETGFTYTIVNQETTPHDQKITDEIVAKIKSSRMIIADFTNSSTNVYFEAGFAMGMRTPVIWTCKEGHEFSFDTGQFPHITWKDADDLKKQLVNRIQAIM